MEMLTDFEAAAASMMLFLKNVEEIEIYTRAPARSGAPEEGDCSGIVCDEGGGLVRVGRTRVAAAAAGGSAELEVLREMRSGRHRAGDGAVAGGVTLAACTYELQLLHEAGAGGAEGIAGEQREDWLLHWGGSTDASAGPLLQTSSLSQLEK